MKLTPKQERFVQEYLIDLNATQAAIRAGYSKKTANEQGSQLLAKLSIQQAIQEKKDKRSAKTEVTQEMVLKLMWDQANVDVNDLVEYVRVPCETCKEDNDKNQINPKCPECHGEGKSKASFKDSSKLTGAARRLFNGVQIGKSGIKVLLLDRDKALENVARHLGMFKDKIELSGGISLETLVAKKTNDQ